MNVVACIASARNCVYRCLMSTNLLDEIDAFLAERKIGDHRFGVLATNNGRLLERLRSGSRIWPETADKIRHFIQCEREMLSTRKSRSGHKPMAAIRNSNSPDYLPSGEAGAQRSSAGCAPVSNTDNAVAP